MFAGGNPILKFAIQAHCKVLHSMDGLLSLLAIIEPPGKILKPNFSQQSVSIYKYKIDISRHVIQLSSLICAQIRQEVGVFISVNHSLIFAIKPRTIHQSGAPLLEYIKLN